MTALTDWADALAAWAIPAPVRDRVAESPWVLPRRMFGRRAHAQIAEPLGATHAEALWVLDAAPGSVLDVGAAAGATSLPLVGRAPVTELTAVDSDAELLADFAARAEATGITARTLRGQWPDVAARAPVADLVLCGNVVYNVPDLAPFVDALTRHARRRVVVELAAAHPLTSLNPLWRRFHGIDRPDGPTADDCVAALAELGIRPAVARWRRPPEPEHATFPDLVDVTRRRLCLPPEAADDVAAALTDLDVDRATPPDLGSSGCELVTLSWPGAASG